jgi:hypothetical protein
MVPSAPFRPRRAPPLRWGGEGGVKNLGRCAGALHSSSTDAAERQSAQARPEGPIPSLPSARGGNSAVGGGGGGWVEKAKNGGALRALSPSSSTDAAEGEIAQARSEGPIPSLPSPRGGNTAVGGGGGGGMSKIWGHCAGALHSSSTDACGKTERTSTARKISLTAGLVRSPLRRRGRRGLGDHRGDGRRLGVDDVGVGVGAEGGGG